MWICKHAKAYNLYIAKNAVIVGIWGLYVCHLSVLAMNSNQTENCRYQWPGSSSGEGQGQVERRDDAWLPRTSYSHKFWQPINRGEIRLYVGTGSELLRQVWWEEGTLFSPSSVLYLFFNFSQWNMINIAVAACYFYDKCTSALLCFRPSGIVVATDTKLKVSSNKNSSKDKVYKLLRKTP